MIAITPGVIPEISSGHFLSVCHVKQTAEGASINFDTGAESYVYVHRKVMHAVT